MAREDCSSNSQFITDFKKDVYASLFPEPGFLSLFSGLFMLLVLISNRIKSEMLLGAEALPHR